MSTYTLSATGLVIPDTDEFERTRRTYNIHSLVLKHKESGRFFQTEYSLHEMEGFEWEWGPGMGNDAPKWTEVYPHTITTVEYKTTRQEA